MLPRRFRMDSKKLVFALVFILVIFSPLKSVWANQIGEISVLGSYSKSTFGADNYSTTKKYTFSVGYNLTPITQVEIGFTYSDNYYKNSYIQTVTQNEQTLSATLVQFLVPPEFYFQPYVKAGAAQYNRRQNGSIYGVATPEVYTKSPSGVAGAGARMFFLTNFSFKVEGVMYFPDFKYSEGKNNYGFEGGLSFHF